MLRRLAVYIAVLVFATGILFTSVLRTAAVKYEFSDSPNFQNGEVSYVLGESTANIDYKLAYPGKVLPDNPLWPVKALRDRVWFFITTNPSRKAELLLLFADKRVAMSKNLFEKGNADIGYSTLTKAEKYLARAINQEKENRAEGIDTSEFLQRIALSSLKHYQVMEEIKDIAQEDAKPSVTNTQEETKKAFEEARNAINEIGGQPPENPFDWN